jgi:2,5-furandicarboxylate decarboxylase 1
MAKDLRSFLLRLQERYPGGLITITEERGALNPNECECTALLYQLERMNRWPTTVFENVSTPSGERWPGHIIFSEAGNWPNVAVALDLDPFQSTIPDIVQALHQKGTRPKPWTIVKKKEAPVKEVIWPGKEADILRLPSYRKDTGDARVGWFSGIAVAKDLETGRYNCSWHRHHVYGSGKTTVRVNPRHLHGIMTRHRRAGYEELPVAWVYGHHPAFLVAALLQADWNIDEYEFAGALMGESLRLVPSESLGDDFLVPADAEVIVEGFLHLTEKDINGPWSDKALYYHPQTLEPTFRPSAITMRRQACFSENWIGHDLMPAIDFLSRMQPALRERFPRVRAVNYLGPHTFAIQFKPESHGEVNRLAAFALGAFGNLVKNLIIVDEDIDPFDPSMVFFSIGTRVDNASNRIQVIQGLRPSYDETSCGENLTVGGLIIDSTKPIDAPFPEMGAPPRDVVDRLKIGDFISIDEINKIASGKYVS